MTFIAPIPTSRVSDSFVRLRLLSQLQADQTGLVRLQSQITTGRRVIAPSDDPQAASRAIEIQRILDQKGQFQENLKATQSYLTATDTAIAGVTDLLRTIKGDSLSVIGSISSDTQREAVARQIDAAINQLTDVGNRKFRGRYLFAGSRTEALPYGSATGGGVAYNGNERDLNAFSDLDQLITSNVQGTDVLGGLSSASYTPSEINTRLSPLTRLSDLNDGAGVDLGSIRINDGIHAAVDIDLSSAVTIADVERLIEASPPATRTLSVSVTSTGLTVALDSGGGGNLSITNTGSPQVAQQLGIYNTAAIGAGPLVGSDLNPRSPVDLNPAVTADTRLVDLNADDGVSRGSVLISDGTRTSTVDLSSAETVGDVLDLLEANPPAGRTVTARYTSQGITVKLDPLGGGNLTITEVSGNTTAADLGIYTPGGSGVGPVGNGDLNPRLSLNTRLGDAFGVRATTAITSNGKNNDLLYTATAVGNAGNGITVNYLDDGSVAAGSETVFYDSVARTLTVRIESGVTNANQVKTAIANQASSVITAALDRGDQGNDGTGVITATAIDTGATGTTSQGRGARLDYASGVKIVNGNATHNVDLSTLGDSSTFNDLLNAFNLSNAGVLADLDSSGSGIRLRSRISGADFSVGENGGRTATQLGIRSLTDDTKLSGLNFGRGVHDVTGADFVIQRKDGTRLSIDISSASTAADVVNLINNHASNPQTSSTKVTARLAASGNGIELVTSDVSTTAPFRVERANASFAANDLGLVPVGQDNSDAPVVSGGSETITGRDTNSQEVNGVFTSLFRLRDALRSNDQREIQRSATLLEDSLEDVNFARSALGAQQQSIDLLITRSEDEVVELKSVLSDEIEADLPAAISEFAARQASFEATLRTTAQIAQLTLLNFL